MTAPDVLQVMQALEAAVDTIPGLRVSDFVPGAVSPPIAIVGVPPIPEYRLTMRRGRWRLEPTITVLVSAALDRVGQRKLAGFAAPTGELSIAAAIERDRTLGGLVEETVVTSFRPLGWDEVGIIGYFGGVWDTYVVAKGQ